LIYLHPSLATHICLLGALWLFRAIFTSQFDRWASVQASALKAELRKSITDSPNAISALSSTELTTLLIKGSNSLDIYLARFLPQMFGAALTPVAVIVALACMDITSAIIAIITIPIIPFFGALIGRYTNDAVQAKWQSLGTLSKYFEDSLRGIYTLAIFGRHKNQGERIQAMGDRYTDETMKVLRISFLSALVLELAATISVALIAVSIGLRLVSSSMEFFPALAVLVLAPEVYFPLRNAASLFHASADGGAALAHLTEITSELPKKSEPSEIELTQSHGMQWRAWSSSFGAGSLPAGQLLSGRALVIRGASGLGKTTFLNQLIKHQLAGGNSAIGWIPQTPSLIAGTVREIFTLVKPDIADREIMEQLNRVGLFITDLDNGLDTYIGGLSEKSAEISGGQRRRIAIARALAINPSLIIADEPTADLDPLSAQAILNILSEEADRGAMVVAVLHAPDQSITGAQEIAMVER
jgi:ABC-type transport system involved in cytochrome bd biosynthesis fused ATPase/permease subunit